MKLKILLALWSIVAVSLMVGTALAAEPECAGIENRSHGEQCAERKRAWTLRERSDYALEKHTKGARLKVKGKVVADPAGQPFVTLIALADRLDDHFTHQTQEATTHELR